MSLCLGIVINLLREQDNAQFTYLRTNSEKINVVNEHDSSPELLVTPHR